MQNQICKLISCGDVASGLRMFEDGWKVYEMVGWCGRPLGDLWGLPRGFPSIQPQNSPLQENLQDVLETYRIPCISIDTVVRKMMGIRGDGRLREGG